MALLRNWDAGAVGRRMTLLPWDLRPRLLHDVAAQLGCGHRVGCNRHMIGMLLIAKRW
jgi:hypothetical protein